MPRRTHKLEVAAAPDAAAQTATEAATDLPLHFAQLDMAASLPSKEYRQQLKALQYEMLRLQQKVGVNGLRVIIIFEGLDAAGKGGAIRRLVRYLDPRGYRVHSIGPPSELDLWQHYLRRYWMRLPKRGRISIFDDYSWYGRMLLEPIEGLCTPEEYARAPREIREFERLLTDDGVCLLKFWLHVSRDEQLKRFKKRLTNPYKSWKLTPDDWRNREMYELYIAHADAMFELTSSPAAPWQLIAGDDKLYARVAVLRGIVTALERLPVTVSADQLRHEQLRWLRQHSHLSDQDD